MWLIKLELEFETQAWRQTRWTSRNIVIAKTWRGMVIYNCIVSACIIEEPLMCGKSLQNCFWPFIDENQNLQTVRSILWLGWGQFIDDVKAEEEYVFISITKLLVFKVVLPVTTAVCHVGPAWLVRNLACFTKQEKQWEKTHQPTTRPPSCSC